MPRNIFYAQSGGVTAVINATACGVIETARRTRGLGKVYAGSNGILGALREELIDTSQETPKAIAALRHTPAGAFGSCRYKLKSYEESRADYDRLLAVFAAHDIGVFFYNGGGDSQDTANKVAELSRAGGHPITCIGIPKTVDNDLPLTDTCPGFGSVAKYVAVSTLEAGLDVASMAGPPGKGGSSTRVFVLEVMGRHAGWIAAAAGLASGALGNVQAGGTGAGPGRVASHSKSGTARRVTASSTTSGSVSQKDLPPHIILFPEIAFNQKMFLAKVQESVERLGYCVVVASEGAQYANGQFLADAGATDAFGHTQLGGVAPTLVDMIKAKHGYKCHWAVADYLQRAARHLASATDVEQAYAVGKAAVEMAAADKNAVMPVIVREKTKGYKWHIGEAPLSRVANVEKKMPRRFISKDGFGITGAAREYLSPLIRGEDYPPYKDGLPTYAQLKRQRVKKKLPAYNV